MIDAKWLIEERKKRRKIKRLEGEESLNIYIQGFSMKRGQPGIMAKD